MSTEDRAGRQSGSPTSEAAEGAEYVPSSDDQIDERLAALSDEEAQQRAEALLAGLEDYELDEEDAALLGGWDQDGDEPQDQSAPPVLAVVGRPNVGKSTLVNRIIGRREAVVEDVPGVTRDRVSYEAEWGGKTFTVVDTGGWEHDAKGLHQRVAAQAELAVDVADAVLFVVDATVGATATSVFPSAERM